MIVIANPGALIEIGYQGEDNRTNVVFSAAEFVNELGAGVATLLFKRPCDDEPYPVMLNSSGDGYIYLWSVTETDTQAEGYGEAQLVFTPEVGRAKSCIYKVLVHRSLTTSEVVPEPYRAWVDQVIDAAGEVERAVEGVPEAIRAALTEAKESGEFDGEDGADGVSPTVTVTPIGGGHRVTITDADGSESFDVLDGAKGDTGDTGTGIASIVLNADYTLTINYTDGNSYTTPVPIRGAEGAQGVPGVDGRDGSDGVSPVITTALIEGGTRITVTDAQGVHTIDVMNGVDGTNGTDGTDGTNGTTFTPAVSSAGVISWTNDGGKANPQSVDLVSAVISALPSAVGVSF